MEAMKPAPVPMVIHPEIGAKCDGPDQFENFDRGVRAFLAVAKSAVVQEEAARAKKPARA